MAIQEKTFSPPIVPTRNLRSAIPILLALLLGLIISAAAAATAVDAGPQFVIPFLLIVPIAVLVVRYPFSVVFFWLLFFPFVVRGTSGWQVPVYYTLHRAMIPGALWIIMVKSWLGTSKRPMVRFGLTEFVMAISVLWSIGSIYLLGDNKLFDLVNLYDKIFVPFCMYWLIRLIAPTAEDLRRLLPFAFITMMTQAAIGIASWFEPGILPKQWLGEAGERVVGTFKNPAVYTTTIMFLALLLFQYFITSKSPWRRLFAVLIIGVAFICDFISFSRGSWLGGGLLLIGLTIVYPRIMVPLEVIGVTLALLLGSTVFSREIQFAVQRFNDAETVQSRFLTGAKSLAMIEQKPLFGWGYGNYDRYDDAFRVTTIDPKSVKESDHTSHNTYLTVVAEQGIPALFFYLFPALWLLLTTLAVWKKLPTTGFWSRSLLILLWLLILDHFTVSNFMDMIRFNLFGTTIFWMALGLIATILTFPKPEPQPVPVENK